MLKKWYKQQPGGRGLKQTGRDSPLAQSPGFQPLLKHLPPLPVGGIFTLLVLSIFILQDFILSLKSLLYRIEFATSAT